MKKADKDKYRPLVAGRVSGIVLEIGFGSGLNLPYYENVDKLYALDPSKELYDLANERIKKASFPVEYLQASAEHIPLPDNSADAVISTWSLCSIPYPDLALKEILRVLKPGGIFSFIEHGLSPRRVIGACQKCLTPLSKLLAGGCHMDREIGKLILEAGFEIQKLETFQPASKPLAFMYTGTAIARKKETGS